MLAFALDAPSLTIWGDVHVVPPSELNDSAYIASLFGRPSVSSAPDPSSSLASCQPTTRCPVAGSMAMRGRNWARGAVVIGMRSDHLLPRSFEVFTYTSVLSL